MTWNKSAVRRTTIVWRTHTQTDLLTTIEVRCKPVHTSKAHSKLCVCQKSPSLACTSSFRLSFLLKIFSAIYLTVSVFFQKTNTYGTSKVLLPTFLLEQQWSNITVISFPVIIYFTCYWLKKMETLWAGGEGERGRKRSNFRPGKAATHRIVVRTIIQETSCQKAGCRCHI